MTKKQNNTTAILLEWNAVRSYTPNSLQLKDILRCGADDLGRPQNSQTQSQLVWYSHNTSLFVFAWPAAEHRLCPPLGAATTEMDAKAFISLMHHNNEHSTMCAQLSNCSSISQWEEVNKHMMASKPKALLKWIWKRRTILIEQEWPQSKQIMMGHESHLACWHQLRLKLKASAFIVCTIQRIHLHNWFL